MKLDGGIIKNVKVFMDEIEKIKKINLPTWDEIPNTGLYMTEVINFIDKTIKDLFIGEDNPISPAMINNYVKLSYLKEPINKKYYREHIGQIIVIFVYKQVLSIDYIAKAVKIEVEYFEVKEVYDDFVEIFSRCRDFLFKDEDRTLIDLKFKDKHEKGMYFLTISLLSNLYTRIRLEKR